MPYPSPISNYFLINDNANMDQVNNKKLNTPLIRILPLIVALIVLALVVFLGFKAIQRTPSNSNVNTPTTLGTGISFDFPQGFGEPSYGVLTPTDGTGLVTKGRAERIDFSKTPDTTLIFATSTFEGFKLDAYRGGQDIQELCPKPKTYDTNGNGCVIKTIGGREVLVRTQYLADEGVYNLVLTYSVNLTQGEYQGLKVIQSFPSIYSKLNSPINDAGRRLVVSQYAKDLLEGDSASTFKGVIGQIETLITSSFIPERS